MKILANRFTVLLLVTTVGSYAFAGMQGSYDQMAQTQEYQQFDDGHQVQTNDSTSTGTSSNTSTSTSSATSGTSSTPTSSYVNQTYATSDAGAVPAMDDATVGTAAAPKDNQAPTASTSVGSSAQGCAKAIEYATARKARWNAQGYQPSSAALSRLEAQYAASCGLSAGSTTVYTTFSISSGSSGSSAGTATASTSTYTTSGTTSSTSTASTTSQTSAATTAYSGTATQTYSTSTSSTSSSSGGGGCFVRDTQVMLSSGESKNIQDIKTGEWVLDSKGQKQQVVNTMIFRSKDKPIYNFNGGDYFYTANHPFMTLDGWKSIDNQKAMKEIPGEYIGKLGAGDMVLKYNGQLEQIYAVDFEVKDLYVYNIEVTGAHEYLADEYVVHNITMPENYRWTPIVYGMATMNTTMAKE